MLLYWAGSLLPISEIIFKGLPDELPKIVTYDGKWIAGQHLLLNTLNRNVLQKLDKKLKRKLKKQRLPPLTQ